MSVDIYPYTYWQSTLEVMFPNREFDNRQAAVFAVTEIATPEDMLIPDFQPDPSLAGKTLAEITTLLEEQILRTHVFAALDTLEFLRRSGRMSRVMAGLGTVLQIKPLLKMYDGEPTAERVRTRKRAIERLIGLLSDLVPLEQVALVHTHAPDRAQDLQHQVQHLLPEGEIPSVDITPVIGAHIGPGAVGFACVSARKG